MYKKKSQHKLEILQADDFYIFCSLTQRSYHGMLKDCYWDPLLSNHSIKCLTNKENTRKPYKDILCLFGTLAFHLHGNERLEQKNSNLLNLFLDLTGGIDPAKFRGVCKENIVQADVFSYNIDVLD